VLLGKRGEAGHRRRIDQLVERSDVDAALRAHLFHATACGLTLRKPALTIEAVPSALIEPMDALGEPTRRAIFERLAESPRAVGELAREFPVSRPAVSQHLKVLKDARLVIDRPAGTRRIYEVDPTGLRELRDYLDRFWGSALSAYKAAVEQSNSEESE
jgi:DNA-binding transcriptional ArsR family regulator